MRTAILFYISYIQWFGQKTFPYLPDDEECGLFCITGVEDKTGGPKSSSSLMCTAVEKSLKFAKEPGIAIKVYIINRGEAKYGMKITHIQIEEGVPTKPNVDRSYLVVHYLLEYITFQYKSSSVRS